MPAVDNTNPNANKPAVEVLKNSKLATPNQLELMGGDVNLVDFRLQMRNKAGISLESVITEAQIERTIEGASVLTVTVIDNNDRDIQRSRKLGRKVDVKIDGLWFTLVGVKKNNNILNLVFEEREVNVLRYYAKFAMASRETTTRAEFALKLIQEVKEMTIPYEIPDLHVKSTPSDVIGPDQTLVSSTGDFTQTPAAGGIAGDQQGLTAKGEPATKEQIGNANAILAEGARRHASRKVLVCSIMTAIDESVLINLVGGDRDSVGLFQQRHSQGWPATRNIPVDAGAFFDAAISIDQRDPTTSYNDLCQRVQNSGTPYAYGQYQAEAEKFVDASGTPGANASSAVPDGTQGATANNQAATGVTGAVGGAAASVAGALGLTATVDNPQAALSGNYYTRGTLSQKGTSYILTKENTWNCLIRLFREVNWRVFVVSGKIYIISDQRLFMAKPFMSISEDTDGINWINYDYDEGKKEATVRVECHLSRWSAPPGSIVQIHNMGVVDGRWLVNDVSRSLFNTDGTITLKKPLPVLPEPTTLIALPSGFTGPVPLPAGDRNSGGAAGTGNDGNNTDIQNRIVNYAKSQLGLPYAFGTESPGVSFDCSGLTHAAYGSVGIPIPRRSQEQFQAGPIVFGTLMPGDLVFFITDGTADAPGHVGIYIGDGKMIDAPHTGAVVRVDPNFTSRSDYIGATRPWDLSNSRNSGGRPG